MVIDVQDLPHPVERRPPPRLWGVHLHSGALLGQGVGLNPEGAETFAPWAEFFPFKQYLVISLHF